MSNVEHGDESSDYIPDQIATFTPTVKVSVSTDPSNASWAFTVNSKTPSRVFALLEII
jgi:hypothetical protein